MNSPQNIFFRNEIKVIVYPNPAVDKLFIELRPQKNMEFEFLLFDSLGTMVIKREANSLEAEILEINVGKMLAGVYTYKVYVKNLLLSEERLLIHK